MKDIFDESGLSVGAVYRYFASKEEIVEAIAEQRHTKEAELIRESMQAGDARSIMHRLADLYLEWLSDPEERRRRRVGVQIWAEAVHNERLRAIVQRGADQRLLLAGLLQDAQRRGQLPLDVAPDALTRCIPALFQGFILQQAWEPDVDIGPYLQALHTIIDATMPDPDARTR